MITLYHFNSHLSNNISRISGEFYKMRNIGCHLSIEGGYSALGERARCVGADTFQFFTKNPRGRSHGRVLDDAAALQLCEVMRCGGMKYILAHAPYTYNPASRDEKIRSYTAEAMSEELLFLEKVDGAMYNFHPGCHVGQGERVGMRQVSDMLSRILVPGMKTRVLLESMAGKGTELGRSFEQLAAMIEGVDASVRDCVGVCLDTCHIHDAGYNISEDPDGVLDEFDRVVGLDRLCTIHVNDSKNERGAAKDRHERLGAGHIPLSAIERFITHPRTAALPIYLETPCELDGYAEEISVLSEMRERCDR